MEIAWSLYKSKDGYESVAVALNHRYRKLVQEAVSKTKAGEDKVLVALAVEAKMQLFMSLFVDYGADDTVTREELFLALCEEFDIPKQEFNSALQHLQEIMSLWQQRCEQ